MTNFQQKLIDILKKDPRLIDKEGDLIRGEVIDKAWKIDKDLITLLLGAKETKWQVPLILDRCYAKIA